MKLTIESPIPAIAQLPPPTYLAHRAAVCSDSIVRVESCIFVQISPSQSTRQGNEFRWWSNVGEDLVSGKRGGYHKGADNTYTLEAQARAPSAWQRDLRNLLECLVCVHYLTQAAVETHFMAIDAAAVTFRNKQEIATARTLAEKHGFTLQPGAPIQ